VEHFSAAESGAAVLGTMGTSLQRGWKGLATERKNPKNPGVVFSEVEKVPLLKIFLLKDQEVQRL